VQPANPSSGDVFAGGIVDCAFDLTAPDLVTLRLQVGGPGGAQMGLLTQVALDHTP
jgi:hypothetical protein